MYKRKYQHRKVKLKWWTAKSGQRRQIRLYSRWLAMRNRVAGNCKRSGYRDYWAGKPVYWQTFDEFRDWALSHGYSKTRCSLDRIDPDKGYTPDNCEWVTKAEQTVRSNTRQPQVYRKRA